MGCATAVAALLGACVDPASVRQHAAPTDPFLRTLYSGYLDLSEGRAADGDRLTSSFYASKARSAARGNVVAPEELSAWEVQPHERNLLIVARARLTTSLAESQRNVDASHAATAQVMFDCWLEMQEAGRDAAPCRARFWESLARLDENLARHRSQQSGDLSPPSAAPKDDGTRSMS